MHPPNEANNIIDKNLKNNFFIFKNSFKCEYFLLSNQQ